MAINLTYNAQSLDKKLNGDNKPKENIIEKYLRENPTGQEKQEIKPAMWEDLEDLYMTIATGLQTMTDQIVAQIEYLRAQKYISDRFTRLVQMYEKDLSVIVDDINGFRKRHTVDGQIKGESKKGVVPVDDLMDYFQLGEEYKNISLRTVQLFQPIMLDLTEISMKVSSQAKQITQNDTNINVVTDVSYKTKTIEQNVSELDKSASVEDWIKSSGEQPYLEKPPLIVQENNSSQNWDSIE